MTPTQRSLAHLRADGWLAEVVEKWNPHARIRQDLFGFVDIIAVREGETLAVQTTSADHKAERVAKIESDELAHKVGMVREAGWAIHVHGWRKSAKTRLWTPGTVDVS
jgi:hypothetical protein